MCAVLWPKCGLRFRYVMSPPCVCPAIWDGSTNKGEWWCTDFRWLQSQLCMSVTRTFGLRLEPLGVWDSTAYTVRKEPYKSMLRCHNSVVLQASVTVSIRVPLIEW